MKKLISLLLALMLLLSLATTAFADMEGELTGGSITIKNAVNGNTYSAYQILYLESYDADAKTYVYKANSDWAEWLATQTQYVTIDAQDYVTWVTGANVADFAAAAQTQLASKTADKTADAAEGKATLSGLKLGYYLVDTTLGTLCSLDTTNPSVEMEEKNEVPTVTKEVQEDSDNTWGETNDAEIGQTVQFKANITVKKGAVNYILHDTMSAGLTYQGVSAVKIGETTVETSNYEVKTTGTCGCTFEVVFNNDYIKNLAADTVITVYYTAKVNENAVIAGAGNPNEVELSYGEKPTPDRTPEDTTITYVWDMDVLKYGDGNEQTKLKGAKFVLLNSDKTKVATITNGKLASWTVISENTDLTQYALTTDANGSISIEGLDAETYYLREIEAPAGYNKLASDVEVVVVAGTVTNGTMNYTSVVAKVNNQSGTELPSTGGMGTTLFYAIGGIMVLAAVVLLVTKKRMASAE